MNNITINREGNFRDETVNSIPLGINNIILQTNEKNVDLKKDEINNIKPMLSGNSNTIRIPDGKRIKIKPLLNMNKKVPSNTFSMIANPKKNMGGNNSEASEESSNYSDASDEILSNNSRDSSNVHQQKYVAEDDEEDEEDDGEDPDDYSSIESNTNKNKSRSRYAEDDEEDEDENSIVSVQKKQKTYEEIQQEKQKLLINLERLQKQGYPKYKK